MKGYYDDLRLVDAYEYPEYDYSIIHDKLPYNNWEFCLNTHGTVILRRGKQQSKRFEGPVLFWHHHTETLYYGLENKQPRGHLYFVLTGERVKRMFESLAMMFPDGYIVPDEALFQKLLVSMRTICQMNQSRDYLYHVDFAVELEKIMAWLTHFYLTLHPDESWQNLIQKVVHKIQNNPMKNFDFVHRIPAELDMSYSQFRVKFKQETGMSPHAFLMEKRLDMARFLLKNTTLRIKEISERCGFDMPSSFHKFFVKYVNIAPLEYRKKMME